MTLKILTYAVLICLSPIVLCFYRYPGWTGSDCPTAREVMLKRPPSYWIVPKCNKDGTFQEKQCYDEGGPDDCMCHYKDGTLLSLARQGFNTTTCLCHVISYERSLIDKDSGSLKCDRSGYFRPLQCSLKSKKCWCVTKYGNELTPPSLDRKGCSDVAHLL